MGRGCAGASTLACSPWSYGHDRRLSMATLATRSIATPFPLPPLPYPEDALAPVISAKTLSFHHGKHHKAYVTKVNELVAGTEFEGQSLERIVLATSGRTDHA